MARKYKAKIKIGLGLPKVLFYCKRRGSHPYLIIIYVNIESMGINTIKYGQLYLHLCPE